MKATTEHQRYVRSSPVNESWQLPPKIVRCPFHFP